MPGAFDTSTVDPESSQVAKAESMKLWLPSQLDPENRDVICAGGVITSEKDLRFAQLEDSLDNLRRARRVRYGLITFHKAQLAGEGQKIQTRSRGVMQTIQERIDRSVRRYRVARNALLSLDPHGDWKDHYPPLNDADNRGPGREPEEQSGSDGRWVLPWIWLSNKTAISPDEVNEDMRVEWAQCMARADRWEEEVVLLQEEMRRIVQYLEWRSRDWLSKAGTRSDSVSPTVHSGLSAYAKKQSAVYHNLAVRFCQRWHSVLLSSSLPHAWAAKFLETHKEPLKDPNLRERKRAGSPLIPSLEHSTPAATTTDVPLLPANYESHRHETQDSGTDSDGNWSDDESGYES